jgi:hypothetical protein
LKLEASIGIIVLHLFFTAEIPGLHCGSIDNEHDKKNNKHGNTRINSVYCELICKILQSNLEWSQ